jgi:predicted Zn-dependent protease
MKPKSKKILWSVVILGVLLIGGGYGSYRGYKSMRQSKLIKQAHVYLAKPDHRKALLVLQRALRYNPRDLEACRMMAELHEANRSSAALMWRSRVVEFNPKSVDDRLALAKTATVFRDYATATNALEKIEPASRNTAAYHNVAGAAMAAANQLLQAEAHFLEASRLEPQNPSIQLNLAVVRLQRTNTQTLGEAREALQRISANPTNSLLRCQALRELIVDAMRHRQSDAALAWSQQLLGETNSAFRDRILRLDVLRETHDKQYNSSLAAFQTEAGAQPARIYELGTWLMANASPLEALNWLQKLPSATQSNQTVALLIAECRVVSKEWGKLYDTIEGQNWAELEFLRHAFKARALRGRDLAGGAKSEWELALKIANGQRTVAEQIHALKTLLQLAAAWNWESEGEELLWSIVNRYPNEKWAFNALNRALIVNGRTRPLMQLYTQELKRSPSDLAMKNNLAMTALLLDAKELKPHDLARDVYQKVPTNSAFASTYAFSLHLQEKNNEALKVMQTLQPKELQNPSIAGYYGLFLKTAGDKAKAIAYLGWAARAPMLPEERKLFEEAKAGL